MSTYVKVKEETSRRLHLVREPSIRAWAILVGLISLGAGAAYYSADYLLWKLAYLSGAVFVGLTCMEDWEECVLDKDEGKVVVKKIGMIQKYFQDPKHHTSVVAELEDITSVGVESETVKYSGTGYQVVLQFNAGYSIGVTETATLGNNSEHEMIAEKIRRFLQLDEGSVASQSDDEGNIEVEDVIKSPIDETVDTLTDEVTAPSTVGGVADDKMAALGVHPGTDDLTAPSDTPDVPQSPGNLDVPVGDEDTSSDEGFEYIKKDEITMEEEIQTPPEKSDK